MADDRAIDLQRAVFSGDPAPMSGVPNGKRHIGTSPGSTCESRLTCASDRCREGDREQAALTVKVADVDDVDADGKADLIWRHTQSERTEQTRALRLTHDQSGEFAVPRFAPTYSPI